MLLTRSVFVCYLIIIDTRSWFENWQMYLYYNLRVIHNTYRNTYRNTCLALPKEIGLRNSVRIKPL